MNFVIEQSNTQRTGNILVVDDTPDNLRLLAAMLATQGYEVRKALSGKMAITACQMLLPDVILLDINMPDMDGYQVCQCLKENSATANIPVIFISALDDILDKVKAFDVGGVDYITKPFNSTEVILRIENQLNLRKLQLQLQQKNHLLEQALSDLKSAQIQQIQNEKMIALGKLVGGIAHEINNPISSIYGNLEYLEQYHQDIIDLINIYQQEYPEVSPRIQAYTEIKDINFMLEDLNSILAEMYRGSNRIRSIVLALQNFARQDEAKLKKVDIHEGIESTLLILENRLQTSINRPKIEIIRNYGKLLPVDCYVSELNQVFMHLIDNAIDAIAGEFNQSKSHPQTTSSLGTTPMIHISTQMNKENRVAIAITDNGPGIPPETLPHIFDPFFTTKDVNKGRGLGLAISYQIITQKHHGTITCDSLPGKGTKFTLEIPITQTPISPGDVNHPNPD